MCVCVCVYYIIILLVTLSVEAKLAAAGGNEVDGGRKKRSGSNPKNISLEIVYKSGGLEQKLVLSSPISSHTRKLSNEWLRALKKVSLLLEVPLLLLPLPMRTPCLILKTPWYVHSSEEMVF